MTNKMKFWVHRDKLTGKYYTTTKTSLGEFNKAYIYRTYKTGAVKQVKQRISWYKIQQDRGRNWTSEPPASPVHDLWVSCQNEMNEANKREVDPLGNFYIEIVEVELDEPK